MTKQAGTAPRVVADPALPALRRLRRRLTVWYVLTFACILLALGALLFIVIARQTERQLEDSLLAATQQIAHATTIREQELRQGGSAADAVEELHIPDRALFLFDSLGTLVSPHGATVRREIMSVASAAFKRGSASQQVSTGPDDTLFLYGARFTLANGHRYVGVAAANGIELEDRYATLIWTFAFLSVLGLMLVAVGGSLLARTATRPVETSIESMRRFMAEAAHELRTPISVLLSRADVTLQQERDAASYATAIGQMRTEAEQLGRIVDDLLTLARADAGERPLRREIVAIDELVLDAVTSAGAIASARSVRLQVGKADEGNVDGDPALLRQLFMILLDNAIKYTPAGGVVTASVARRDGVVDIAVRDSGPGISTEELPRLFDPFYRGASARGVTGGAGLGLSIADWIVTAHDGRISIDSGLGEGTTATVELKLQDSR